MTAPALPSAPLVLVVPGLGGSGPAHWQTRWEALYPRHRRVQQRDWDHPDREDWLATLGAALEAAAEPAVLVAHSLGCILVAHAAARPFAARIAAALLVAPADVDSFDPAFAPTRSFAPVPLDRLPFPATVVASRNDPYATLARARLFAGAWGSELVDLGSCGHINADSGLDDWPLGRRLFEALLTRAAR